MPAFFLLYYNVLLCHKSSLLFESLAVRYKSHPTNILGKSLPPFLLIPFLTSTSTLAGAPPSHIPYQTRCPKFSNLPHQTAHLRYSSSRFHQTPQPGAPTSRPISKNRTTTFTTRTPGVIESLTEASTYSPTEASLMSVAFSFSVLVSWPYCTCTPITRLFSSRSLYSPSAGYPLISHFTSRSQSTLGGFNLGGINASGQVRHFPLQIPP